MGKKLSNPREMRLIYETSRAVYEGRYSIKYAIDMLDKKVPSTRSSIEMYIDIYSCMRKAKCYKMGTGEKFTKFLLDSIFRDNGIDEYRKALSAVKGNYYYRKSVNNTQPSLIRACEDSIRECGLNLSFDDIPEACCEIANTKGETSKKQLEIILNSEDIATEKLETAAAQDSNLISYDKPGDNFTENVMELNIQPSASILNVFSRLSYKPWYAIAEFVDNSTQSYISHATELSTAPGFDKLIVKVVYDVQENTLVITDNAFGMEIDRFRDAILLDSRNASQTGRNEFGMGLKTAASWFGKVWKVTSTQFGSTNKYTATVDIPKLERLHLQGTKIYRETVSAESHGTVITIEQVTKKITGPRTIGKIRDLLSSMYRRDINNRNIEIWFNGEPIVFDEYPILVNFRGRSWKKELAFSISFNERSYNVTGFVAIMNPGSFPKAGFALFRQDRVVIGGTDSNYKPAQIFGQAQSQRSLKLFGELNMDDFPVNQAKDGFIWDDGLEDIFVDTLKSNIQEYIDIADMSIKERATETQFSTQASSQLQQEVSETIDNAFRKIEIEEAETEDDRHINDEQFDSIDSTISEYIDTVLNVQPTNEFISSIREYKIPLSTVTTVSFSVQWARGNKQYWIEYSNKEGDEDAYDVVINIDHPFFMPYTKAEGFQKVLEKFALAFVLAERQAKLASDRDGYIQINTIKHHMNRFLGKLAEN